MCFRTADGQSATPGIPFNRPDNPSSLDCCSRPHTPYPLWGSLPPYARIALNYRIAWSLNCKMIWRHKMTNTLTNFDIYLNIYKTTHKYKSRKVNQTYLNKVYVYKTFSKKQRNLNFFLVNIICRYISNYIKLQ